VGALGVALALAFLLSPGAALAKVTLKETIDNQDLGITQETKLQLYGFSQLEMRGGDGWLYGVQDGIRSPLSGSDIGEQIRLRSRADDSGIFFNSQRIRVGFNYFTGRLAGKLFLDFNQPHERLFGVDAGMPRMIKDAFVAYKFGNTAFIRLGMIKTPLGMDFTTPGWNLDIIQRSLLEKGLVLERQAGVMLSGRLIGFENKMQVNGLEMGNERQGKGFGYDIGVFNPTSRSASVINTDQVVGKALSYVGRAHFDWGKPLHVELAYGVSQEAGGYDPGDPGALPPSPEVTTEDYKVLDFGVMTELLESRLELKFEYIDGQDIRGLKGYNQRTAVFTAGFLFAKWGEAVVKTYQAEAELSEQTQFDKSKLGNTFLGLNFFFNRVGTSHRDLQRNKIVVNYIIVNGDEGIVDPIVGAAPRDSGVWYGIGGFADSTFGIQWQYKY
jgi:hypothetical protein